MSISPIALIVNMVQIQFSISTQFSSIWPINRALSGGTTLGQSGPESEGIEEVLFIPQTPALLEPQHQIV